MDRLDIFFTLTLLIGVPIGGLMIAAGIVKLFQYVDRNRPMATNDRRPDAMRQQMDEEYEEATRRG